MKQTRLIPIVLIAIMLLNCILPLVYVTATTTETNTIELNSKLYYAIKEQLEEQNINAICNDFKRTITISNEELAKVNRLDLSEKEISDLTGLDAFSSVISLDLSSNKLTGESNLGVLNELDLEKLDLSTNNIEDISEITNLDSITEINLHNQIFTQVEVISLEEGITADNQVIVSKELPQILVEAGILNPEWLIATKSYEGNNSKLNFIWTDFENDLRNGPTSVNINVGEVDDTGIYNMYKGLLKLNINIKDKTNPLSESNIDLYYLIIDSNERAAVFKDENLYSKVKEQLTQSTSLIKYNTYNEELRTYVGLNGKNGETLYKNAYDDPMILTFDLNTLINDIPALKLSNLQVEDLSGIETFVGLEKELNLSYNYINSIEKIIELQENKDEENIKLQGRFSAQLSILRSRRAKLMEELNKIDEIDVKIAAVNAEIHKAYTEIDYLDRSAEDYEKKLNELIKKIEEKNKELKGYEEEGKIVLGLEEQRKILINKANEELFKVKDNLESLYEVYNKEYRATTILTLDLNNITKEQFKNLSYNEAKQLYKSQIDRIANLENNKALSNIDIEFLDSEDYPKMDENGIIKNPISTALLKEFEDTQEEWSTSMYRARIKDFIYIDGILRFLNAVSLYMQNNNYNLDYDEEEILNFVENYFENTMEENEDNIKSEFVERCAEELPAELIEELLLYIYESNVENYNEVKITDEYPDGIYSDSLSFILGISGKFANLTNEEIEQYISLPVLKKLNLENNIIEDLTGIEELTDLRYFNLSDNEIRRIDVTDWSNIQNLKELDLSKNFISSIECLEVLKKLEVLNLSDNLLEGKFSFRIASLPNLKVADFSINKYTDISSLISQYQFIAKDKEMTVNEYLDSDDTIDINFNSQLLEINAGNFIVKEGEQQIETVKLPPIFTQLKELDPHNTIYSTISIFGKVKNDGTVGLIVSKEEGKHYGVVSVDSLNGHSIGEGTICVINYTVMNSKVDSVNINDSDKNQYEVELGKSIQFNASVDGVNIEDTTIAWSIEGNKSHNTTIDNTGLLKIGTDEIPETEIIVKATSNYDNSVSAQTKVKVVKLNTNVVITPGATEKGLEIGSTKRYATVVTTEAEDKSVTWTVEGNTSENTKIDENGVLTIGEDETVGTKLKVKATSNYDNTKFAEIEETVIAKEVVEVKILTTANNKGIEQGSTKTYEAEVTVNGQKVTDRPVTWELSGSEISKIENGTLKVAENETEGIKLTIKAKVGDVESTSVVETVIAKEVVEVKILTIANNEGIEQGSTKTYEAEVTVNGQKVTDRPVTWELSGSTVSKMENGTLKVAENEAEGTKLTIKAKVGDAESTPVVETVIAKKVAIKTNDKVEVKDSTVLAKVPGTTTSSFVNGLVEGEHDVKVLDKNGKEVAGTSNLATGMKLKIDGETEYTIVVTGDVNGDGKIDSLDSANIKRHRIETEKLENEELEAADVNRDGVVNRIDSFLILYYRAEKIKDFSETTINSIMK